MNKPPKASIRTQLIVEYSNILHKARKGVKGLRIQHLSSIMLIGDSGGGIRCGDICKITKASQQAAYQKLLRVIRAGFIYKQDKRYYLTPSGHSVYSTICKEFDVLVKEIVKVLVEEARD